MEFNRKVIFPPYILFQTFDDEAVLLDIRTQEHFGLDQVAAVFISRLREHHDLKDAYEHVKALYDVDDEQLSHDLDQLLRQLQSYELIDIG